MKIQLHEGELHYLSRTFCLRVNREIRVDVDVEQQKSETIINNIFFSSFGSPLSELIPKFENPLFYESYGEA